MESLPAGIPKRTREPRGVLPGTDATASSSATRKGGPKVLPHDTDQPRTTGGEGTPANRIVRDHLLDGGFSALAPIGSVLAAGHPPLAA